MMRSFLRFGVYGIRKVSTKLVMVPSCVGFGVSSWLHNCSPDPLRMPRSRVSEPVIGF